MSFRFYTFTAAAVTVLDRSANLCHIISDTACNPFPQHFRSISTDRVCSVQLFFSFYNRQVMSDVAAILWIFSASYTQTLSHESGVLPRGHLEK